MWFINSTNEALVRVFGFVVRKIIQSVNKKIVIIGVTESGYQTNIDRGRPPFHCTRTGKFYLLRCSAKPIISSYTMPNWQAMSRSQQQKRPLRNDSSCWLNMANGLKIHENCFVRLSTPSPNTRAAPELLFQYCRSLETKSDDNKRLRISVSVKKI